MNMKSLYENVSEIEKTIEAFSERELTRTAARSKLIKCGYSSREAEIILENTAEKRNGTSS